MFSYTMLHYTWFIHLHWG